jgi:transglutaminase-like putative cysteine protease
MPNTVECASQSEATRQPARRFEIVDSCDIGSRSNQDESIELWYPIIPDNPYQRVLDISISAPPSWAMGRELEHGNLMLYAKSRNSIGKEPRIQIRYLVERAAVSHAINLANVRPLETPALFERWLRAERFVDVDAKTRALAREVVGAETNVLFQARVIYDYVTGAMTYDAAQQSWKGSTEHALVCSVGNCNDIHALFISLCRSVGIPARLILGQALEAPLPGQDACDLCGYHCWAEYFASGLGWVPVDASCACRYGKHHLFGDLEMNHVAWSVGRDIELNPPQKGERLLFFAGPYAEINGAAQPVVERHVRFTEA